MNDLMKVDYSNERPTVLGRDLHAALEVQTAYKDWFPRMCEYGFVDGTDFCSILSESTGGRPSTNHQLTLDMAKELCMIQRTDKGKECRQYFLELERKWNSPEIVMARALQFSQKKVQELTPFANVGKAVAQTPDCIPMGDLAKILRQNGVDIGRTRLFEWLRINGYIQYSNRTPTQKAMNLGLFRIVEQPVNNAVYHTTYVTGKGQHYFINKFTEVVE